MRVLRQLLCVIVLGFLWMPSVAAQQRPKSTIVGAGTSNVQKRARTEAEQYAASVAPDRDSSTFSALVRARCNQLVPYFISQSAQVKREIKNALTQFDKRAPALKNSLDRPTTVLLATPDPKTVSQIYLVDQDPSYCARRSTFSGRVYGGLPT